MASSVQLVFGVITGEPRLTALADGEYRFAACFVHQPGTPAGRPHPPGQADAELVLVGPVAEQAWTQFALGDRFVAAGTFTPSHRSAVPRAEFCAVSLGHDLGEHRYAVDRTRRRPPSDRPRRRVPRHRLGDDPPTGDGVARAAGA